MALILPDQGEEILLELMLAEDYTLHLFVNDALTGLDAAGEAALTEADLTEASFAGYAAAALTGGSWTVTAGDPTEGVYAQQSFTRSSSGAGEDVYGYFLTRTSDGALVAVEGFPAAITVDTLNDVVRVTPTLTTTAREATVTARGILSPYQRSTANSPGYVADATSDFVLANLVVDSTRSYRINLQTVANQSAAGSWFVHVHQDGTQINRASVYDAAAAGNILIGWSALWLPDSGTYTLDVRVDHQSGSSTLTFAASTTVPREFWVEDIGPRV